MVQAKKLKSLPNLTMKERMNGLTKNHYKCSSFVHESKRLAREHRGDLPQATFPLSPADLPQLWKGEHRGLQINTTVPLITSGDPQDNTIRCFLTLTGKDCRAVSRRSMDPCVYRWICNRCCEKWRSRSVCQVPRRRNTISKHSHWQILLQLYGRNSGSCVCRLPPWSETPTTNVNRLSSCLTYFQSWKLQQETNSLVLQKAFMRSHSTGEYSHAVGSTHCGFPGNEKANLELKEDSMQDNSVTFQEKKTLISPGAMH